MTKFLYPALIILMVVSSSCTAQPLTTPTPTAGAPFIITSVENPYAPKPEDINRQVGGVILTSLNLTELTDTEPARIELNVLGLLPSVCSDLRIEVLNPDKQYQIMVNVYSLIDTNINCENVFQQFETSVVLGIYSPGRYTVWVNDGLIGDFVSEP